MKAIFFLLLSLPALASEVCTALNMNSGGRHSIEVDCYEKQGFIDGSHVPTSVSITVNGKSEFISNPRCDGVPCTLEMLREPGRYASLRSQFPADAQGTFSVDMLILNNPNSVPLYRRANDPNTTYTLANPFSIPVPRMDVRTHEITYVDSRPDDPALARPARGRTSPSPERPVTPAAGTGGVVISSEEKVAAPPLATNCKYRDRVVDGKDAAPSIVNLPGCSEKICLAEARCDVGGRRRLVNVYCPAIGTENCPDATACANSEEFGTTVEALEVRELAPGARPQRAGGR